MSQFITRKEFYEIVEKINVKIEDNIKVVNEQFHVIDQKLNKIIEAQGLKLKEKEEQSPEPSPKRKKTQESEREPRSTKDNNIEEDEDSEMEEDSESTYEEECTDSDVERAKEWILKQERIDRESKESIKRVNEIMAGMEKERRAVVE